jgi:hypothetical protein
MFRSGPLWLVCMTTLAGCGGATPRDRECEARARTWCARLDACSGGFVSALVYGDVPTCVQLEAQSCKERRALPGLPLASPLELSACTLELESASCDDFMHGRTGPNCQVPIVRLDEGAPCFLNSQCKSFVCTKSAANACGRCAAVVTPVALGQPCNLSRECAGSAACVAPSSGGPSICVAWGQNLGDPCDAAQGWGCDTYGKQLFCGASKRCERVTLSDVGGSCGTFTTSVGLCKHGSCVLHAAGGTTGACQALLKVGEPCYVGLGAQCEVGAWCDASKTGDPSRCRSVVPDCG